MIWLFVAAAIFGGSFLIPMILGGLDSDVGESFGGDLGDADLEIEVDGDIDSPGTDLTAASPDFGDALGSIFASLLSFRTVVFFTAFFGTSGIVLTVLNYGPTISLITATIIGLIAGVINSTLFGLIKNSQANSQISESAMEGRPATVVVPMSLTQRGRIRIDLSGQPQYMVARSLDDGSQKEFDVGASVVVVKVENGTALVASLAELESGEEFQ